VNLLPGGSPPSPNAVLEVDNSHNGAACDIRRPQMHRRR
jgi:hypothetical protein